MAAQLMFPLLRGRAPSSQKSARAVAKLAEAVPDFLKFLFVEQDADEAVAFAALDDFRENVVAEALEKQALHPDEYYEYLVGSIKEGDVDDIERLLCVRPAEYPPDLQLRRVTWPGKSVGLNNFVLELFSSSRAGEGNSFFIGDLPLERKRQVFEIGDPWELLSGEDGGLIGFIWAELASTSEQFVYDASDFYVHSRGPPPMTIENVDVEATKYPEMNMIAETAQLSLEDLLAAHPFEEAIPKHPRYIRWAAAYFGEVHLAAYTEDPERGLRAALESAALAIETLVGTAETDGSPDDDFFYARDPVLYEISQMRSGEKKVYGWSGGGYEYALVENLRFLFWLVTSFDLGLRTPDLRQIFESVYARHPLLKEYLFSFGAYSPYFREFTGYARRGILKTCVHPRRRPRDSESTVVSKDSEAVPEAW